MKIEVKKNKNLLKKEKDLINKNRERHFGRGEIKDFKKDYEQNTLWFFVKENNKIVALGGLRPIKIKYLRKNYNIRGFCSIIAIKKKRGYGKAVIQSMINYLKRYKKTGLGFCERKNAKFYEKSGLKIKKDLINRFVYLKPKAKKRIIDEGGDGIYYEGRDKFISKVLSTNSKVIINVPHW
jgi:hypothetical protein